MKQKCVILIDGSNFYYKLKDLEMHNLLSFDFTKFSKLVARTNQVVEYVGFSHKPSVAMVSFCSESTLLKKDDLLPFIR